MKPTKNVAAVQWLRGIAAMMVVAHHARNATPWLPVNPLETYGALAYGVDIFFVISGFIMLVAARDEKAMDFLKRRIVRVVPLYWIATGVLLLLTSRHVAFQGSTAEIDHLLKSIFFIPHYSLSHPNMIWPYLVPGWTLNYEMFFYLIFFVALLTKHPILVPTAAIIALVGIGWALPASSDPILKTYTDSMMLEFIAGIWIGKLYLDGKLGTLFVMALPVGLAGLLLTPYLVVPSSLKILIRNVFSALTVIGAASLTNTAVRAPILEKLGDASYSIYLSHVVIGLPLSYKLVSLLPVDGATKFGVWILTSLLICAIMGYLIHLWVEKPVLKMLRSRVAIGGRLASRST